MNPGCRCGDALEIKKTGVDDVVERHIGVVAFDDACLGLDGADYGTDTCGFICSDFGNFIEQNDVAELDLLDDEVLDVVFAEIGLRQVFAAAEFVTHAQSVDDGDDAVETGNAVSSVLLVHHAHRGYCLGDRRRFADAAGFDDYIVEAP